MRSGLRTVLVLLLLSKVTGRLYYEVQPARLFGVWNWSLAFSEAPYMFDNYINTGAAVNSRIADGNWSTILAGSDNLITADYASIGGGSLNTAAGKASTVRGGIRNTAKGDFSVIAGGAINKVHSNYGTIIGGYKNEVRGRFGTVLGGARNTAAGRYSLAAGFKAKATDDYSASFGFNSGDECESKGDFSVRFCSKYISFGDGDDPTEMLKMMAAVDKSRRLSQFDEVETSLDATESRLLKLTASVRAQGEVVDALSAML